VNIALWIVAGVLAAAFSIAGSTKLLIPRERLARAPGAAWVWDFSPGFIQTVGAIEIVGVIGLILPRLLDIAPVLTPLAAVGLGLVMIGAIIVHFRRHEIKQVLGLFSTYLAAAIFVALGRFFIG
jgi:DoxX-like family